MEKAKEAELVEVRRTLNQLLQNQEVQVSMRYLSLLLEKEVELLLTCQPTNLLEVRARVLAYKAALDGVLNFVDIPKQNT